MNKSAFNHLCYKIRNANVNKWPFPHFHIEQVFPEDFYQQLRASLPAADHYETGASGYNGRKFADPTENGDFQWLLSEDFLHAIVGAFPNSFQERFPCGHFTPKMDLRLVLDGQNYAIGPHTDAKWKIVSLLFYLPEDYALRNLGTAIYLPRDRNFRCPGGPHHKFDDFELVYRAPFHPNSCFGFFKTDDSFHGVPPITIPCRRDVLLWNLYDASLAPH